MKRFLSLLVLSILFFAFPTYAQQCTEQVPYPELARLSPAIVGGGVPAAASCTTPTGDELWDSFGDGGSTECWTGGDSVCDNNWAIAGAPTIAACPGTPPANTACTNCLRISTDSTDENIRENLTIANNVATTIGFSFYVASAPALNAYTSIYIAGMTSSTVTTTTKYFNFGLRNNTGSAATKPATMFVTGADATKYFTFAENTWYNVVIALDAAGDAEGSSVTITGGITDSDTFQRDTDANGDIMCLGVVTASFIYDIYYGNVYVTTP